MRVHSEFEKIAGTTVKNGTYYELQGCTQYDENENVIPHYDGEETWYRVIILLPSGLYAGTKEFGPDEAKAYKWLKNRR